MRIVPTDSSNVKQYRSLVDVLIRVIESGRVTAARVVNQAMTTTYWLVGRQIVEHEQSGARRAGYGEELIERLSLALTARFGRGFSPRNIEQMRKFYLWKQIPQAPSAEFEIPDRLTIPQTLSAESRPPVLPLPWSHYSRLLSVRDAEARAYYEEEANRGCYRHPIFRGR